MSKATAGQKIEALKDPIVKQVVFDALHRRRMKYSAADNSGQHIDYIEIVDDMLRDYRDQVTKEAHTQSMRELEDQVGKYSGNY